MISAVKNMLIGLFVTIAIAIVVGMILFLEPSVGDGKQKITMRFSNINGLSVGTRVLFAGKPIGEVTAIEQIPDAREQPADEMGQVYFYQLILSVDSSAKIYNTDEFTVQTSGLLGEKSIAIIPKAPPKGIQPQFISPNTPLYAESIDPLESAFNELSEVADKVEETLDKIMAWIDQNGPDLGAAIRSFDDAMSEASNTLARVNELHVIDDFKIALQNFGESMAAIRDAVYTMQDGDVFENLSETLVNLKSASKYIDVVTEDLALGRGTLGKLISQDDLYLQINAILSKANTLMNDVNHYGLFFNLNKEWQRTRVKQVAFLNALTTPDAFKEYFEKEVDLINTSMSRISMLIDKAEQSPETEEILQNKRFKSDFAELLRLTEELLNNLKLYNSQLIEARR